MKHATQAFETKAIRAADAPACVRVATTKKTTTTTKTTVVD